MDIEMLQRLSEVFSYADINKKLPIIEINKVIQGEGKFAGTPNILIRLSGCRLRCAFKNSICDTYFASYMPETGSFSLKDVNEFVEKAVNSTHCFITGGGPTLHKQLLPLLVLIVKHYNKHVTIETEGSEYVETAANFISLSPKLSNSIPVPGTYVKEINRCLTERDRDQHEKWRKNYQAMKDLITFHPDYQLKPVVTENMEKDIEEIKELQQLLNIPNDKVYLMPEGMYFDQLTKLRQKLIRYCAEEGYNYSDRLHIIAFNNERYR